jgi:hypothetical protein
MGNMMNLPSVESTNAPNGKLANLQTIKMMKGIAREESSDPLIRQLAINILNAARVGSHQYVSEARALATWVQKNIAYVKDAANVEQLHSPKLLIKKMQAGEPMRGDCDDMSLFLATLLLAVGHKPAFKCVRYKTTNPDASYNHIYVIEKTYNLPNPEMIVVMDCIVKNKAIGYQVKYKSADVYEV